MFIKLEIDLNSESDRHLLSYISTVKKVEIVSGESKIMQPMQEVKKEMTEVSNNLATKIGTSVKMTTNERAKVAAAARWEKVRREKELNPQAPKQKVEKKPAIKRKEQDFSKAKKVDHTEFPTRSAQDMILDSFEKPQFPDGRDIMEGKYEVVEDEENETFEEVEAVEEDFLDEELEEIKKRAQSYEE